MKAIAKALKAFGNRLVVLRDPVEKESPGGIVLPETNANRPCKGTVISAGALVNKDATCDADKVSSGSRIYFNQYAGQVIEYEGEEYLVIAAEDIFAFIDA